MEKIKTRIYHWLRWSEKYSKTDMVYLAKGGFWVSFGQIITNSLSFILIIVCANFLPKETYGLYRYILSLAGVLNIFTLTGMNKAVSQAVATGDEGVLRTSVKYQLRWNVIMLAAFWLLAGYYFTNDNQPLALSLFILSFFSPLTAAFNTYGAYLDGKKEFRLNNIFSAISTLIYVLGLITAIVLSGNVIWLVVAYSLATFGPTLFFYLLTLRTFTPPTAPNNKVFKYGRELTFISAFGTIVSQLDNIILSHFWGATQLATYSLAVAIPNRATSFIKNWLGVGFPKIAIKTPKEINQALALKIFQGMIVGTIIAAVYIIIAPYVFRYLLPQYLDTVFYSQLLTVSFVFALPNRYLSLIFTAQKLSKLIFINNVIQSSIRLSLYVVLGILGGILGLISAQVLSSGFGLVINIAMWRYQNKKL